MTRPGLSSATRPAVTTLLNRVVGVRGAVDTLYRSPAAEHVAATAFAALLVMHAAGELIETLGLNPQDVTQLWNSSCDDDVGIKRLTLHIREQYK
jgi:hypothetical protein